MGLYDGGCYTVYPDGKSWGAEPHDTADYHIIANRLGYGDDIMRYAIDHEVAHHCVTEWAFNRRSAVLWPLAHGMKPVLRWAVAEEALAMTFQKWLRCDERPIIGDVDWHGLKARATEAIDELFAS